MLTTVKNGRSPKSSGRERILPALTLASSLVILPTMALIVAQPARGDDFPSDADVQYNICVHVTDDRMDKSTLYITAYGTFGTSGKMELDNPGVNDFETNRASCFEFRSNAPGFGGDIGAVNDITLDLEGSDDICYGNVTIARKVRGAVKQLSTFRGPGCLGDNGARVKQAKYKSTEQHSHVYGRPKGKWYDVGSGGKTLTAGVSSSMKFTDSEKKSMSREELNSVTVAVENETEMAGIGDVTTSVSGTKSLAVTSATETMASQSVGQERSCSMEFDLKGDDLGYVWQWGVSANLGKHRLEVRTCHFACTKNYTKPHYPLGDSRNGLCR